VYNLYTSGLSIQPRCTCGLGSAREDILGCIFDGFMKKELFVSILEGTLLPFIKDVYPDSHKLMQDNDPKHTSGHAKEWMDENGVNWWKTPAESPDLNPIENLWHELKEYIRREAKPKTKDQLIQGIEDFWGTVDKNKCLKYIGHLRKGIPKVIEVEGAATGC
jgi:transposase